MLNRRWPLVLLLLFLMPLQGASAQQDALESEVWALTKIKDGQIADFDERCGELNPQAATGWDLPCRQIRGNFIAELLTNKDSGQLKRFGVHLRGMHVSGQIDLSDSDIMSEVWLEKSRIDGDLKLSDAHLHHVFSFNHSMLNGQLLGIRMTTDSDFFLDQSQFQKDASLQNAKIGGSLIMEGTKYRGKFIGIEMDVGRDVSVGNGLFEQEVSLTGAKVGGDLKMSGASFQNDLEGTKLQVGGDLLMKSGAQFLGSVSLVAAKVGRMDLERATISQIDLSDLSSTAGGGELKLSELRWQCRTTPRTSRDHVLLKETAKNQPRIWPLGNLNWQTATCSGNPESLPALTMRNMHVDSLQEDSTSWPPRLNLEGFNYSRIGSQYADNEVTPHQRTALEWEDWLKRDQPYSPQPYSQLASVLSASGQQDMAYDIMFASHERERHEIWQRSSDSFGAWLLRDFPAWLWLSFLSIVGGYGIGFYTFRVLWWVMVLTVLGAITLSFSPFARRRSFVWRCGASLHRLLPVVTLNKEFDDCFDSTRTDDDVVRLHRWQIGFFAIFALTGWVLGFLLLAAMSNLSLK